MENRVSKIKKIIFVVCLILISLFYISCTDKAKSHTTPPTIEKKKINPTEQDKSDESLKEKVVKMPEEFDASNLPLISAIPNRNIYLYAIKPNGVILYIDGKGRYFNWDYLTPRFILPKMNVDDYDNDGKEELSIILYVGSGTGYAVEDLHIIELSEKEFILEEPSDKDNFVPNPKYFKDNFYEPYDYLDQLNKIVKLKTYYKKGELMANIRVDKKLYNVSLKGLQSMSDQIIVKGINFGNIIYFEAKDEKLTAQFAFGVTTESFASPEFIGDIKSDVKYSEGKFTLENLRFEPSKD